MMTNPMTVLVTGAEGVIGTAVREARGNRRGSASRAPHDIRSPDDFPHGAARLVKLQAGEDASRRPDARRRGGRRPGGGTGATLPRGPGRRA